MREGGEFFFPSPSLDPPEKIAQAKGKKTRS